MSVGMTKPVSEMTKEELEKYHHTPESDLSLMVCKAKENDQYAQLKDFLQKLSEESPKKINAVDSAGITALHCAVACSSLPAVILLLKFEADVNATDNLGFTPVFLATGRYPNTDIALHLIQEGKASINAVTKTGATALHGAALQGNIDSIKLLLKHGADPRMEDEEGTTAFELSKDEEIRTLLHDAVFETDRKKEEAGAVCSFCKKTMSDLKRCARCQLTMYCNKDCQTQHWHNGHKEECSGYVTAKSHVMSGGKNDIQTSFYHPMGSRRKNVKMFTRKPTDAPGRMEFLRKKRFIVKVQLPIGVDGGNMMVYNADRTCEGFIHPTEKDYGKLARRIRTEGYMGIKAFFWSDLCEGNNGEFKVYHGKTAPFQNW